MSNPPTAADRRFANAAIDQQIDNARQSPTRRNVTVHVLDTLTEARTLIGSLLPTDEAIFTVSSQTLVVSGIGANIRRLRSFALGAVHVAGWTRPEIG